MISFCESLREWARKMRFNRIILVAPFIIYTILCISHLDFTRDDWAHYASIINMRSTDGEAGVLKGIITNSSTSPNQPRIFFSSFLVHYIISVTGKLAPKLVYSYQTILFVSTCILSGLIVVRLTGNKIIGYLASVFSLITPLVTQPSIWINNLFFVQPVFLYFLAIYFYLYRQFKKARERMIMLTVLCIAAVSSGESILFVVIAGLSIILIKEVSEGRHFVALAPIVGVTLFVGVYTTQIMSGSQVAPIEINRLPHFYDYIRTFWHQSKELIYLGSDLYGKNGGIKPTILTIVATVLITTCVVGSIYLLKGKEANNWPQIEKVRIGLQMRYISILLIFYACSLIPLLIGMLNGTRPGPDLRYQYVPGFILIMICSIGVSIIIEYCSCIDLITGTAAIAAAYLSYVTLHNVVDIWPAQKVLDKKIWSKIEKIMGDNKIEFIITFHPDHPYLMAPYNSNAISDFQADWGISGRLKFLNPEAHPPAIYRDAILTSANRLKLREYYSDAQVYCVDYAPEDKNVLYLSFRYPESFSQMLSTDVLATSSYTEYVAFKKGYLKNILTEDAKWRKAKCRG